MNVNFNHWKNGDYGDPKTHYMTNKLPSKTERTKILFRLILEEHQDRFDYESEQQPKIIEYGCNNGRNLFPFYCFGFECYGLDLNMESLQVASDTMFFNKKNFRQLDLFNETEELSILDDDYFDVSFCMGFLMHLPDSHNKKQLVKEMIRTSKSCYIYEPYMGVDREETDPNQDGWHLSMLDYEKYDFGLKKHPVDHKIKNNENMKIWKLIK